MDSTETLIPISDVAYDASKPIAHGGMATVYKGLWFGLEVAIKVIQEHQMNASVKKQLLQEVKVLKLLRHRNVILLYGISGDTEKSLIILEYANGGSLQSYLKTHPSDVTPGAVNHLLHQISLGMEYLHSQNPPIYHGDLKSANCLLHKIDDGILRCIVKLSDFGMSKIKSDNSISQTKSNLSGTLRWISPERFQGGKLNEKVDVYAFAMTSYEIVSLGKVPFELNDFDSSNEFAVMNAIFTQARPVRPPNSDPIVFSDEHWQLIERCWTQSADLRPPFSEIADTLNRMSLEVKSVVRGNTIRLSKDKGRENDDNSYKTATSVPIATSIPVSAAVYTVQHEPTYLDTSPYQLSSSPNSVLKAVTPVPKINNSTNPFLNIPEPIPINTSTSSPIPNAISFKTQYNSYNEYRHGTSDIKAYADAQKPSNQPTTMYSDVFVSFTAPNSTPCSLAVLEGSTTRLFSGYENGLIREWDVDKSRIIRTFVGHNSRVNSLTVTEYPPRLYSGSSDNTVREWNLQTGGIQVYDAHITDVNSVAVVSGEIPQLFSGSADNTIRKWNVLYGNSEKILYGHNSAVCALVSVPGESNRLFSGSDDFSVLEWKVSTGQSVRGFVGHSDCVSSIAVLPGSPIRLFSGSFDKSIIEWDLKTGKPLDKFFGHTQKITTITVLGGNPPRLFSGSADQTIREWNLETRTITRVYRGHTDEITSVVAIGTVSPRLFSSSRDGSVKDWVVPLEQPVTTRKLDTENDAILASELDRQLNLEIIKEQPLVEIQEKKKPKDKMLKSMHHPEWYKTSIAEARILPKGEHYPDSTINAIAILTSSPPALFVGCEDRMIRQIDFMSGRVLRVFAGHRGWISSIALYPNQSFPMLSGSSDRTVKEWSLYSGACTRTYVGHKEPVTSVVYVTGPCYNQFQFFSASLDKTIREWDRQTGQSVRIFSQSKDEIYAIAALSHSHHPRLFSSSKDSTITEWDYHSGQQVRLFTAHSNSLVAMSILYLDQRSIYLYSASADGLIREWNLGDYQSRIISEIAGNVTSLASFHTPPYRLYSSSNDNLIKEWDITQVKVIPDTKNPRVKLVAQKGFQF